MSQAWVSPDVESAPFISYQTKPALCLPAASRRPAGLCLNAKQVRPDTQRERGMGVRGDPSDTGTPKDSGV